MFARSPLNRRSLRLEEFRWEEKEKRTLPAVFILDSRYDMLTVQSQHCVRSSLSERKL